MNIKHERLSQFNNQSNSSLKINRSRDDLARRNRVAFKKSTSPSLNIERNVPERYTPNTELADFPQEIFDETNFVPDLSILCRECQVHINLNELIHHKEFHSALKFFGFSEIPNTLNDLHEKRKLFLKNISKNLKKPNDYDTPKASEWNSKVRQINDSFELLKSYMTNSFESTRLLSKNKTDIEAQGESKMVSNELIVSIGTCAIQNKPNKPTMEDTNIILDSFGENENITYIGTFDGYEGDIASSKCQNQLHLGLLHSLASSKMINVNFVKEKYDYDEINNLEKYANIQDSQCATDRTNEDKNDSKDAEFKLKFSNYVDSPESLDNPYNYTEEEMKLVRIYRNSFKYAYRQMDKLLARGKDETSKVRWSGATGCSCIIEKTDSGGWIHVANSGDVEAILVIDNSKSTKKLKKNYKVLSRLHTLNDCIKDRYQIEKNGGRIIETSSGQKKIEGLFSITRGFGFHGDKKIKKFINPMPTVRSYKIEDNHVCLIVATKGLWSALNYEKVADIVLQVMPIKRIPYTVDRPTSPSVKAMLHQYYYNRNKDKIKEKSNMLQTVHDNNELEYMNNQEMEQEYENQSIAESLETINKTHSSHPIKYDKSDTEYYRKSSRPRSVPHETLVDKLNLTDDEEDFNNNLSSAQNNNLRNNKHLINFEIKDSNSDMSSSEILDEKDDGDDDNDDVITDHLNLVLGSRNDNVNTNIYKANSDIYPTSKKNVIINENRDLKVDINELKSLNKGNIKPIRTSSENSNHSISQVLKSKAFKEHEKAQAHVNVTVGDLKVVQVTSYELNKTSRKFMNDRKTAKRLDISEALSEALVTSALIAGSSDNITVNCILLPGCNL